MGLLEGVASWVLKGQLAKLQKQVEQNIGSQVYEEILRNVRGYPVYLPDNAEVYINQGFLFNPNVYSIVSFITQKAGSIPWNVYEVKSDKALQKYKAASHDLIKFKRDIIKTKALVAIENHELAPLFLNPNELQSWSEFIEQVIGFKLVTGNSYVHCIGPTAGVNVGLVKELWPLPAQLMNIVAGDAMQPIKQYEITGNRGVVLQPNEVIHLKYWTPNYINGQFLYGVSPIQAGRRVLTRSNSSYDASVASFQNMGASGILSPESSDIEPLTTAQQIDFEKTFAKKTGPKNAGKPFITGIPMKWQQVGMSPVDLNIIDNDKMDLRILCNIYHVPSELFNDASNKTYSNTKEAGSAVYTNAVIPALTQFRDAFNKFIYPRYGGRIYVDFDTSMISELQDDLTEMTTALQGAWWLTGNEKRDLMSFDADELNPQMDDYMIPAGLVPMSGNMNPDDIALDEALNNQDNGSNDI